MKRICLGKITDAHGVRGMVKIFPFGGVPKFIEELGPVYTSESGAETLHITMKNLASKGRWLASVEGVTERNGAEALRGTELYVPRDKLPEVEEGAYYYDDLIGLVAVDESGADIGKVIAVENFGAGDLLEIQLAGKNSFYLPFNNKTILNVGDKITVQIPEGLIE